MIPAWLKALHLLSVILWIGPALGAYWVLFQGRSLDRERRAWLERHVEIVLRLEHAAFAVLIVTGLMMLGKLGIPLSDHPFLGKKLALFSGIFLFEVFDIWLHHWKIPRLVEAEDQEGLNRWRKILMVAAVPTTALLLGILLLVSS